VKRHKLIVRLKGGLGNQMFQYATARAMAERNKMELVIDTYSGFVRDKTYRRSFSLGSFNLSARLAKILEQGPFWFEKFLEKYFGKNDKVVKKYPWGLYVNEPSIKFYSNLVEERYDYNVWLDGFWQTEKYFHDTAEAIANEFTLSLPVDKKVVDLGKKIREQNAIAVGIRLYEEAPPCAHDITPLSFYEQTARILANKIETPVFYLFCTARKPIDGKLNLPGEVQYVTHDDGYTGELNSLWLLSQFRYHIISNSSFYWWGAWQAEQKYPSVGVYACDLFPNQDSIPDRWNRFTTSNYKEQSWIEV